MYVLVSKLLIGKKSDILANQIQNTLSNNFSYNLRISLHAAMKFQAQDEGRYT